MSLLAMSVAAMSVGPDPAQIRYSPALRVLANERLVRARTRPVVRINTPQATRRRPRKARATKADWKSTDPLCTWVC